MHECQCRGGLWFKFCYENHIPYKPNAPSSLTVTFNSLYTTVISAALSLSPVIVRMEGENLVLFKTMNRCLRVLENVTFMNNENQQYLLELKGCGLVKAVGK